MKFVKNNPFLFLSLAVLIAVIFLMTAVVFISMSLPKEMINSAKFVPLRIKLDEIFFNFLLPIVTIFGLICVGLGFKKGENKTGLFISLTINMFFLIPIFGRILFLINA